ncbi:MAG TPA: hypothetical protein DCF33_16260 [Saprospirales bacterium]|nr:hypothetical protein [Saprospirales bacterium]
MSTDVRIFSQTASIVIYHECETAFCLHKPSGESFPVHQFYGDPVCALIGRNDDWCLIGGDVLVLLWVQDRTTKIIDGLKWIFDLRIVNDMTIQILTDPWGEAPAIWELAIRPDYPNEPAQPIKIKDFPGYKNKPFTESVMW